MQLWSQDTRVLKKDHQLLKTCISTQASKTRMSGAAMLHHRRGAGNLQKHWLQVSVVCSCPKNSLILRRPPTPHQRMTPQIIHLHSLIAGLGSSRDWRGGRWATHHAALLGPTSMCAMVKTPYIPPTGNSPFDK